MTLILKLITSAFHSFFLPLIFSLFWAALLAVDGNNDVFQASTQQY